MTFVEDVNRIEFDNFVRNHPTKSHFTQSVGWGDLCSQDKTNIAIHYVGMKDDNGELVATALLLEKKPKGFKPYFYSPRGYVIDYNDKELLRKFTIEIKEFAKSRGVMFVAIDPDIERWSIDEHGNHVEGFDNTWLIDYLKELGYIHMGYTTEFESRQPRYTFRIDLDRPQKDIEKSFKGNIMKNVRKSNNYASEVVMGGPEDAKILYDLVTLTSERDNFTDYNYEYYKKFVETMLRHNMGRLYLGKTNPAKTVEMLETSLNELLAKRLQIKKEGPLRESHETEARLRKEIELFKEYAGKYPDGVTLAAHFVVEYGDKAWAVHAGSTLEMSETFLNNRIYHDKIIQAKEDGATILDQFGTVGNWENHPLKALHEFKKQWGGRYIEFIGEFNLVVDPFAYKAYTAVRPVYNKVLKMVRKVVRH